MACLSPLKVEGQLRQGEFEPDGEEEVDLRLDRRPGESCQVPGEVESCQSQGQTSQVGGLRPGTAELH